MVYRVLLLLVENADYVLAYMNFSQNLWRRKIKFKRSMKGIKNPLYRIMKKNASLLWTQSF